MTEHEPRVIETEPDTFEVVDPFTDPVRFQFDKPMSEMTGEGELENAFMVSPATGELEVDHRRRGFDVSVDGGYQEGHVYTVTVGTEVQDRWNMSLEEPYQLHFSTGGEFYETLVAGILLDRLTGEEVADARVDVHPLDVEDGPLYTTRGDEEGIFSLRFLPPGRYRIVAYEDLTRSGEPDFTDPQDSVEVDLTVEADTVVTEDLALLLPDTVPAALAMADAEDSITVRLDFDKHLDPDDPLDEVTVDLRHQDEAEAPGVAEILHPHEYDALLAAEAEAAAEEEDPEDPEDPPEDPPDDPPADPPPAEPEPEDEEDPLPEEMLYLRLDGPLEPEEAYELEVDGVVSVNGVPGGGGEGAFVAPEVVEEDPEDDPGDDDDDDDDDDPPDEPP